MYPVPVLAELCVSSTCPAKILFPRAVLVGLCALYPSFQDCVNPLLVVAGMCVSSTYLGRPAYILYLFRQKNVSSTCPDRTVYPLPVLSVLYDLYLS